jgi:hypothetical protein
MVVRRNSWSARTVISVGTLTLAAVIFAFPVDARPATPYQRCSGSCRIGNPSCFLYCRCIYKNDCSTTTKKAFISPAPRPVTRTGAPEPPTHFQGGSRH